LPNTHKILIVDDDPELREALTEQLSLHEEFEVLAVENGNARGFRRAMRFRP
jgi:DNA-binding response OmpR family regulator